VAFEVSADAYAQFMGRYSSPLASALVDLVDVREGQRALDVGCGPGALTDVLVSRLGAANVCAADPSQSFVTALRRRAPQVDVRLASAEDLPFADATFDLTLAQLVVHFMADPVAGLRQMARVTRPGGRVAASVWDLGGGNGPLATFWRAARDVDPDVDDESGLAGAAQGQLATLFADADMADALSTDLWVTVRHPTFEQWWEPFTFGVGPAGDHVARLTSAARADLRERCRELLPQAPFNVTAMAWTTWWSKPADPGTSPAAAAGLPKPRSSDGGSR